MNQRIQLPPLNRRGRRRRDDIENKIYVCSCKKSYYSSVGLWIHIQRKHKGVAPERLKSLRTRKGKTGKRPNQKQLNFIYSEEIDHCIEHSEELIIEKFISIIHEDESKSIFYPSIKKLFQNDPFYQIYKNFQPSSLNPKYNEIDDIFEENCENVFCEFLCEINFKLEKNFYRGLTLIFIIMLTKGIIEEREGKIELLKEEPATNLGLFSNSTFMMKYQEIKSNDVISHLSCFEEEKIVKLMELFYMWLRVKKYSGLSVKINYEFFF